MPIDAKYLLAFRGSELVVDGARWQVEYPIHQAVTVGGLVILLFEYMAVPLGFGNLVAYDRNRKQKWIAETPDSSNTGCYVEMTEVSEGRIHAYIFGSYRCVVETASGRLLSAEFTK